MFTTTSFRVELFPAPPPTVNSLDPEERSRLLRSTRKLGAVLGATPIVVEMESGTHASPKATRRDGRIFHSRSSSISSIDSTEPDYVMVKSTPRSSPYQAQSLSPLKTDSPRPRPSIENKPTSKKRKGPNGALPPIALVFDIPGSQTRSGSAASQPLLLRARPVPAGAVDSRIKSSSNHGRVSKPVSPIASSFNMDATSPTSPTMPTPAHLLNDREKRRKMAKLTRTLGENIPPELVFQEPPRRSLSVNYHSRVDPFTSLQRPSKFVPMGAPPPLAVAEMPIPAPRTSTSDQSTKSTKRRHRPRSLTLGSSSTIAAATAALTRGTTSMDVQPQPPLPKKELPFNSVRPAASETLQVPTESTEFGRRKEREWSGEWNLKDMDDVARRLRGLKGR